MPSPYWLFNRLYVELFRYQPWKITMWWDWWYSEKVNSQSNPPMPISSQILSAKPMFEFCQGSIHGINFIYTSSDEIDVTRSKLTSRFSLARTNLPHGAIINLFPHQHSPSEWKDYQMLMNLSQNSIFLENMLLSKTPVLTELKYQYTFFVNMMINIGLVLYQI